jgi:tetratricopeptide (TPR) repeat protein
MGHPLVVPLPFRRTLASECPELCARTEALCAITVGLAYYAIDDHQQSIAFFTKAAETSDWFDEDGKEIVYVLLGNAAAHLARTEMDMSRLDEAEAYYETALEIRPECIRAVAGQAGVLFMKAVGLPGESRGDVDLDKLDRSAAAYEAVLAMTDCPANAILEAKTHFGLGQVYLIRGQIEGDGWTAKAQDEFDWVVQAYEAGNTLLSDLAGHAYARLGAIARLRGDFDSAEKLYDKAIERVSRFYKAECYAHKGDMYADVGKIEQAIGAYEQAVAVAKSFGAVERVREYNKRLAELHVVVTTDKVGYKPGETAAITVRNDLDVPLWYARQVACGTSFWELETCAGISVTYRLPCQWVVSQHDFATLEPGQILTGDWNGMLEGREGPQPAESGCYKIAFPHFISAQEWTGVQWAEDVRTARSPRFTVVR